MRSRSAAWLLILSASCGGDPFVGEVSHSRYFEYHDQVQEPLCPTLLDRLDQHAELIGGKIGLTLDANHPYRYFKFRDLAALTEGSGGCPAGTGGCARGDSIDAFTYFEPHEQSHDYAYRAWGGWSNGLLDEGQAVAMSCEPYFMLGPNQKPTDVLGMLDWRDLLHLYGNSRAGYGAAGFFVTHLANTYGWDSVGAFYKKVSGSSSAADVAGAFSQVFPTSMDQAWSEALGTIGAPPCQMDWKCMATAMAVGDVAIPDCDGEMHRSVDVSAPGGVVLSLVGDDAHLILRSCIDPTSTNYGLMSGLAGHPTTHWTSLPPGSYAMSVSIPPSSITLQSKFTGALVANSCASAGSVSLDPTGSTYVDFPVASVPLDGWMRLAGGGYDYGVFWDGLMTPGTLSICSDCSAASCVPLPYGQPAVLTISDQAVVHFQNVLAQSSDASNGLSSLIISPLSP